MSSHDLERMVGYIKSVENEVCLDKSIYTLSGITPQALGYFPRPAKLLNRVAGRHAVLRCLAWMLRLFWVCGGAVLFFLREWWLIRMHWRRLPKTQPVALHEIALCSGNRSIEVIRAALKVRSPAWITFPWAEVDVLGENEAAIDVISLLDETDLRKAFCLSVRAVAILLCRRSSRNWILQSYTAYRWFCVYLALERTEIKQLVIADHFDRWAVLADTLIARKRLSRADTPRAQLTLVQHGDVRALDRPSSAEGKLPFLLRHKLNSVNRLFLFDEYSRGVFENDILSGRCLRRGVEVQMYAPCIKLVMLPAGHRISVLFVGHPVCESVQIELLGKMLDQFQVTAYYKPHPTAGMSQVAKAQSWTIIEDKKVFPRVDLLVSYPSTLVQEYAAQGIGAVLHPLQMQAAGGAGVFASLQSELSLLGCEKKRP